MIMSNKIGEEEGSNGKITRCKRYWLLNKLNIFYCQFGLIC